MSAFLRCAACGSPRVMMDEKSEGYSLAKGILGTALIGNVGVVAGINGKKKKYYHCPDCGTTLSYPMESTVLKIINDCISNPTMLVDAVSSSRFINAEKSEALIAKLTSLASRYEAQHLTAKIFTADRIKADNGKIFLITDLVSRAIEQERKISFQYYDYLPTKEKVLRNNGEVYVLSPYALIWSDDRYYLVGYSDKRNTLTPFRVDRMAIPEILDAVAVPNAGFNPAKYANKVIQMYAGTEQTVTLRCENDTMRNVIDEFGENITVDTMDEEHFKAEVQVQTSKTFYSWVFTFAGEIEIIEPQRVRDEYLSMARKVLGQG